MPPRVREVVRLLEQQGWRLIRFGKGDHRIFERDGEIEVVDGAESREFSAPAWAKMKKRHGFEDR
jgi:predicted RNA binding protein YcfA (HicA-like mRNA interferase family)